MTEGRREKTRKKGKGDKERKRNYEKQQRWVFLVPVS
jgi:stalled ribosome alternative rescue factor ArfA